MVKYPQEEVELNRAIVKGDLNQVKEILNCYADLLSRKTDKLSTWLEDASEPHQLAIAEYLIEMGCDVNDEVSTPDKTTPLAGAVGNKSVETVKLFLRHGADPNKSRPIIGAINVRDEDLTLELLKLLIEHGADVNKRFPLYGDMERAFTVLDIAPEGRIHDFLRQHGAKTTEELASTFDEAESISLKEHVDEIVAHFEKAVGPANKKSLIQIVPTGLPIGIHVIPPAGNRKHMTLFTNGLSAEPMNVPAGSDEYRFAELYVDLPGDWKIKEVKDMQWAWPLYWLRKMAQYPHNADTWLGGPVALIANEEPPRPLYKGCRFTTLLLFADSSFVRSDGMKVHLYRMIPLTTSEREYEQKRGLKSFMQALDKHDVPTIVDMNRKPFA